MLIAELWCKAAVLHQLCKYVLSCYLMLCVNWSLYLSSPVFLFHQLPRKLPKRKSRFKRSDGSTSSDTTSSFIKRQVKAPGAICCLLFHYLCLHCWLHHALLYYIALLQSHWLSGAEGGRGVASMRNVGKLCSEVWIRGLNRLPCTLLTLE